MNITCDSCQTRYTISDEKVTGEGRVYKVPCKQCGTEIVVEGIRPVDSSTPSSEPAWYYAVGQERQGPVSKDQLKDLFVAGDIADDTYVWRDGMGDWSVLAEVDTLKDLVQQEEVVATEADAGKEPESSPEVKPVQPEGADPAIQQEPEKKEDDDLFSFPPTEQAPRSRAHGRRDSSVLFSLDELSTFDEPNATKDSQSFVTETSGLIDIRGLANSNKAQSSDADNPFLGATAAASAVSSNKPAFSLSYVPVVAKKKSPLPWILGGIAVVALGVGAVLVLGGGDEAPNSGKKEEQASSSKVSPPDAGTAPLDPPPAANGDGPAPAPAVQAVEKQPKEGEQAAAESEQAKAGAEETPQKVADNGAQKPNAAQEPVKRSSPTTERAKGKDKGKEAVKPKRKDDTQPTKKGVAVKAAPPKEKAVVKVPEPKEIPAKPRAASKGVNDLLSSLSGKKANKSSSDGGGAAGPKTLTSATVRSKVAGSKGRFKSCYKMQPNRAAAGVNVKLTFTIKGSGQVGSARVAGGGLTGPVQSCILRALKSIRFPSFRDAQKKVTYPLFLL